ncbi:MAG: hypothetical protein K2J80_06400 [Oscillospiraceae bacterium]|nr:hypothetical protein [Oscillospiraceae bacterium]
MIIITTARSLKLYHNRAAMDTLGSLPLSYGDRFWGDFLSRMAANFISLVPFSVIAFILNIALKKPIRILSNEDNYFYLNYGSLPSMMNGLLITIIIVYIGVYAATMLISSCCGKCGSAIMFSFIAIVVLPGIFTTYGDYFFSNVIGADPNAEIVESVGMLPPLGPLFSIIIALSNGKDIIFVTEQPLCLVIFLLLTAAMIAGAYFIGKRRRAEMVGESFVFRSVHHVISLTLIVMMIGTFSSNLSFENGVKGFLYVLLITFVIYFILEFSQTKSFKGFWKILLRFASVFTICVAFLSVIRSTNSFGAYKNLPSRESIKEVKISGKYFYTESNGINKEKEYVFRAVESVSGILEEHAKLLQNDNIAKGYQLKITYYLKSGRKMTREYGISGSDDPIKRLSDAVKELPDYTLGSLGVLDHSDFTDYKARFGAYQNDMQEGYIRSDKIAELAELLRYDIENNYSEGNPTGYMQFFTGEDFNGYDMNKGFFRIYESYEKSLAFLKDPNNYRSADNNNKITGYFFSFEDWSSSDEAIRVLVSVDDTSEAAKELLSYIKPRSGNSSNSRFYIRAVGERYSDYEIDPENTAAALKAMYTLFREKYAN